MDPSARAPLHEVHESDIDEDAREYLESFADYAIVSETSIIDPMILAYGLVDGDAVHLHLIDGNVINMIYSDNPENGRWLVRLEDHDQTIPPSVGILEKFPPLYWSTVYPLVNRASIDGAWFLTHIEPRLTSEMFYLTSSNELVLPIIVKDVVYYVMARQAEDPNDLIQIFNTARYVDIDTNLVVPVELERDRVVSLDRSGFNGQQ
jgi:hypothetical protein